MAECRSRRRTVGSTAVGSAEKPAVPGADDPRFTPALDLLRRSGARSVQLRYSDDEEPTVWMVIVEHGLDDHGHPIAKGGRTHYEAAAALDVLTAAFRLCEQIIIGGTCVHCGRPTAFEEALAPTFLNADLCWYAWDPELATFRRGCEGETDG